MENIMTPATNNVSNKVVRPLSDVDGANEGAKKKMWLVAGLIVVAGLATGYLLTGQGSEGGGLDLGKKIAGSGETEAGVESSEFKDEAEGKLEVNDGSVTKEGTHKLVRDGGPSQTVYLTSSVVDLSKFEGETVRVKGETFTSQTAGWFMDVGWVKVTN